MSNLGWLIYFVGFCDSISSYFGWVIGVFAVCSAICIVTIMITQANFADKRYPELTEYKEFIEFLKSCKKWAILSIVCFFTTIAIQLLIPSKQIAILIAASEVGQRVIDSKAAEVVGNKVTGVLDPSVELLETWIKRNTLDQKNLLEDAIKRQETKK